MKSEVICEFPIKFYVLLFRLAAQAFYTFRLSSLF